MERITRLSFISRPISINLSSNTLSLATRNRPTCLGVQLIHCVAHAPQPAQHLLALFWVRLRTWLGVHEAVDCLSLHLLFFEPLWVLTSSSWSEVASSSNERMPPSDSLSTSLSITASEAEPPGIKESLSPAWQSSSWSCADSSIPESVEFCPSASWVGFLFFLVLCRVSSRNIVAAERRRKRRRRGGRGKRRGILKQLFVIKLSSQTYKAAESNCGTN